MSTFDGRTLRHQWFGRRIHPVGLTTSVYTAYLSWLILSGGALGQVLDGVIGAAIGVALAVASVLLWVGWWARRRDLLMRGLILESAGISAVAATVLIELGPTTPSGLLALPVAALCAMSWQIERGDPAGRP